MVAPHELVGGRNGGVPSPWPPRRYGWLARYTDGSVLHEIYDKPPLTPWEDVERERLSLLELVDLWPTGEGTVLSLDVDEGTFMLRGRRLELSIGALPITGRDGRYTDVVQHKEAHSDYQPGHGSTTVLDAHVIGYRRELPELDARVLLRLDIATRQIGIDVKLRPKPALPGDPNDVRVFLDGQRVSGEAAFREATAPPGVG